MAGTKLATTKAAAPEVIEEASLVLYDIPTSAQVAEAIRSGSKLFVEGESDGSSILVDTLDNATTGEDVFAENELLSVKEHYGETFVVQRIVSVRNSDFDEAGGLGIYLIVEATTVNGELVKLAVGAKDPIGKLVKLHELGAFPWAVVFERSTKATKAGFYPVNMFSRQGVNGGAPF